MLRISGLLGPTARTCCLIIARSASGSSSASSNRAVGEAPLSAKYVAPILRGRAWRAAGGGAFPVVVEHVYRSQRLSLPTMFPQRLRSDKVRAARPEKPSAADPEKRSGTPSSRTDAAGKRPFARPGPWPLSPFSDCDVTSARERRREDTPRSVMCRVGPLSFA